MENVGDGPLTYYVMMYTAKKPMDVDRGNKAGGLMSLNSEDLEFETTSKGGKIRYFDR